MRVEKFNLWERTPGMCEEVPAITAYLPDRGKKKGAVVILPGEYDEDITIRFNRPVTIYTWFHLGITLRRGEALPPNYVDLLRNVILEKMAAIDAGKDVIPQEEFMADLYRACSGISYIDIRMFTSEDSAAKPDEYTDRTATITARQRAYTSEDMIEVEIDG